MVVVISSNVSMSELKQSVAESIVAVRFYPDGLFVFETLTALYVETNCSSDISYLLLLTGDELEVSIYCGDGSD